MLLNEFCLKNVRVLVIASDLQMLVIKKLYLKKVEVVEGFFWENTHNLWGMLLWSQKWKRIEIG